MKVRQKEMHAPAGRRFLGKLETKLPDTSARVENQHFTAREAYFEAWCIAAIAQIASAWRGDGAANSPKFELETPRMHRFLGTVFKTSYVTETESRLISFHRRLQVRYNL